MPVDTSIFEPLIAATPKPASIQDVLDAPAKALALKSAAAMAPLKLQDAQQTLQAGALELRQKQQDLIDQQVYGDAVKKAASQAPAGTPQGTPPNPDAVFMNAIQDPRGFSGKAAQGLLQQNLKNQETRAGAAKDAAQANLDNTTALEKKHGNVSSATQAILNMGDPKDPAAENQRAVAWKQYRADLIFSGDITPDQAPEEYPGYQGLQALHDKNTAGSLQLEITKAAQAKVLADAEAAHKQAMAPSELEKSINEAAASRLDPDTKLNPAQTQEASDKAAALKQKTANDEAGRELETKRVATAAAELELHQKTFDATFGSGKDANGQPLKDPATGKPLTGEALLNTLPTGRAAQVRAFAEGRETQLPRGSAQQPFLDLVNQYDPTFNNQRADARKDYAPGGKSGQNIQSLNTATVHLDQLGEAAKAMDNGSFVPGNAIVNSLRTTFGGSAPTNFAGLKAAVASEMASALKGNATDQEIAANARTIGGASSPGQLAGIIDTNMHVLGAKLNTKDEQYQKAIGPSAEKEGPVLPTAAAAFAKHGIQPINRLAAAKPPAGAGPAKPNTQADYDALASGALYIGKDGQTYKKK